MDEENFGYSFSPAHEDKNKVNILNDNLKKYRAQTAVSFLELIATPYVAEKCHSILPEPWNQTVYSGMLLLEAVVIGIFLHSSYDWWKTSRKISYLK